MISSDFTFLCLKRWWPKSILYCKVFTLRRKNKIRKWILNNEFYSSFHKVLKTCRTHMLKTWIWIDYSLLKKALTTFFLLSAKYSKLLLPHERILIWITKWFPSKKQIRNPNSNSNVEWVPFFNQITGSAVSRSVIGWKTSNFFVRYTFWILISLCEFCLDTSK